MRKLVKDALALGYTLDQANIIADFDDLCERSIDHKLLTADDALQVSIFIGSMMKANRDRNKLENSHADVEIPPTPLIVHPNYLWYEIEPDPLPVRCCHCGKFCKVEDCVYIVRDDGGDDCIAEKSCLGKRWLEQNPCGSPPNKHRTAARIWRTRTFKLSVVRPKKDK
jgi:hypothetical protein